MAAGQYVVPLGKVPAIDFSQTPPHSGTDETCKWQHGLVDRMHEAGYTSLLALVPGAMANPGQAPQSFGGHGTPITPPPERVIVVRRLSPMVRGPRISLK